MHSNYFSQTPKRKHVLDGLLSNRVIKDNFYYPLGIILDDASMPSEGFTVEFMNTEVGDFYFYNVSISSNRLSNFFMHLTKFFRSNATLVIERFSEDINRDYDVFLSDSDTSLSTIKKLFWNYQTLWLDCGFVGFGIQDENSGFEVFIDSHKQVEITIPPEYMQSLNLLLDKFFLTDNDNVIFLSDCKHWHYSLSSLVGYTSRDSFAEYIFDYYDIINNLKHKYALKLIDDETVAQIRARWFATTIRGLGKCKNRTFVITYYIVAETEEEMETIIDEEMQRLGVEYYYIYDYYNVNPDLHYTCALETVLNNSTFKDAAFGIWGASDIFIGNVKDIISYIINRPYAAAYKRSV